MAPSGLLYLMYHELELPGRELCQQEEGYIRYVVHEGEFQKHLAAIRQAGLTGINVGEALRRRNAAASSVVLTFDDGCETDWTVAAPALREAGFQATFYLVAGFLQRRGYLSNKQARALAEAGFEIGCHSMTHPYLTDLQPAGLTAEIVDAKYALEQIIGKEVKHFSCPGGRWNKQVAEVAEKAGYASVATSRIGRNSSSADPLQLARVAVLRGWGARSVVRFCLGRGLFALGARQAVLSAAKRALGNSLYERVRTGLILRG